jgi:hypothetical protein
MGVPPVRKCIYKILPAAYQKKRELLLVIPPSDLVYTRSIVVKLCI